MLMLVNTSNWPAQRHVGCTGVADLAGRVRQRKRRTFGRAMETDPWRQEGSPS